MSLNLTTTPFMEAGTKRLTLREAFEPGVQNLTGSPMTRLVQLKFLTAVATAAVRPELKTLQSRRALTPGSISRAALAYLDAHADLFDLDGEKPFLQCPEAKRAKTQPATLMLIGGISGNTPAICADSLPRLMTDAERIMSVLFAVVCAPGGKKFDPAFKENPAEKRAVKTAPVPPALGLTGSVHAVPLGDTLLDTILLNLFSEEELKGIPLYGGGIGEAPWEKRPRQFDAAYPWTLMGRLVPMVRCALLEGGQLHLGMGVIPVPVEEGAADPTVTIRPDASKKKGFAVLGFSGSRPTWQRAMDALGMRFAEKPENTVEWTEPDALVLKRLELADPAAGNEDRRRLRRIDFCGELLTTRPTGDQFMSGMDGERSMVVRIPERFEMQHVAENALFLRTVERRLFAVLKSGFMEQGFPESEAGTHAQLWTERFNRSAEDAAAQVLTASEPAGARRFAEAARSCAARALSDYDVSPARLRTGVSFAVLHLEDLFGDKKNAEKTEKKEETA